MSKNYEHDFRSQVRTLSSCAKIMKRKYRDLCLVISYRKDEKGEFFDVLLGYSFKKLHMANVDIAKLNISGPSFGEQLLSFNCLLEKGRKLVDREEMLAFHNEMQSTGGLTRFFREVMSGLVEKYMLFYWFSQYGRVFIQLNCEHLKILDPFDLLLSYILYHGKIGEDLNEFEIVRNDVINFLKTPVYRVPPQIEKPQSFVCGLERYRLGDCNIFFRNSTDELAAGFIEGNKSRLKEGKISKIITRYKRIWHFARRKYGFIEIDSCLYEKLSFDDTKGVVLILVNHAEKLKEELALFKAKYPYVYSTGIFSLFGCFSNRLETEAFSDNSISGIGQPFFYTRTTWPLSRWTHTMRIPKELIKGDLFRYYYPGKKHYFETDWDYLHCMHAVVTLLKLDELKNQIRASEKKA